MSDYHLAQLNIARMLAPIDSPQLAGFVERLEPVNAIADAAPGFVWRLQTDDGDATALRPFGDDMLVNLSVWQDLESLRAFVFNAGHLEVMRRRREWFAPMDSAHLVLWWVPAGHIPDADEAKQRLAMLETRGPTAEAFNFRQHFPAPDAFG